MTITVSVEELRDFEKACIAWSAKRSEFFAKQLVVVTGNMNLRSEIHERQGIVERMVQWEKENPAPKLVPDV